MSCSCKRRLGRVGCRRCHRRICQCTCRDRQNRRPFCLWSGHRLDIDCRWCRFCRCSDRPRRLEYFHHRSSHLHRGTSKREWLWTRQVSRWDIGCYWCRCSIDSCRQGRVRSGYRRNNLESRCSSGWPNPTLCIWQPSKLCTNGRPDSYRRYSGIWGRLRCCCYRRSTEDRRTSPTPSTAARCHRWHTGWPFPHRLGRHRNRAGKVSYCHHRSSYQHKCRDCQHWAFGRQYCCRWSRLWGWCRSSSGRGNPYITRLHQSTGLYMGTYLSRSVLWICWHCRRCR